MGLGRFRARQYALGLAGGHRGASPQVCLRLFQHLPPEVPGPRTPHCTLVSHSDLLPSWPLN